MQQFTQTRGNESYSFLYVLSLKSNKATLAVHSNKETEQSKMRIVWLLLVLFRFSHADYLFVMEDSLENFSATPCNAPGISNNLKQCFWGQNGENNDFSASCRRVEVRFGNVGRSVLSFPFAEKQMRRMKRVGTGYFYQVEILFQIFLRSEVGFEVW